MADDLDITDDEAAAVATAPRVSLQDIEDNIAGVHYVNGADVATSYSSSAAMGVLTICVLETANGFTIVGKSAPASPENFNRELGEKFAHEDAVRQLWGFMGYALRDRLHRGEKS